MDIRKQHKEYAFKASTHCHSGHTKNESSSPQRLCKYFISQSIAIRQLSTFFVVVCFSYNGPHKMASIYSNLWAKCWYHCFYLHFYHFLSLSNLCSRSFSYFLHSFLTFNIFSISTMSPSIYIDLAFHINAGSLFHFCFAS